MFTYKLIYLTENLIISLWILLTVLIITCFVLYVVIKNRLQNTVNSPVFIHSSTCRLISAYFDCHKMLDRMRHRFKNIVSDSARILQKYFSLGRIPARHKIQGTCFTLVIWLIRTDHLVVGKYFVWVCLYECGFDSHYSLNVCAAHILIYD